MTPAELGARLSDSSCDVIVVGTGAAGLTCALTAAELGLRPLVLEASATIGGTTAVSGGVLWVPNNDRMRELGMADDTDVAIAYAQRLADGRADESQIRAWLENAPAMARAVEGWLDEPFLPLPTYPDYQPEREGGKTGGRSLDNALFDTRTLGEWQPLLRKNPITGRAPITIGEAMKWGVFYAPFDLPYKEVAQRSKDGWVHGGAALIGRMLKRLLDLGVEPVVNARVVDLCVEDGRVVEIQVDYAGERVRSTKGQTPPVVFASGGFEWDVPTRQTLLKGNPTHPVSPPSLRGDGLSLMMRGGARLANLAEAWWVPVVEIPGEVYDAAPLYRSEFSVRCLPHSMIVNRDGRRFVNEALNYNDVVKPFFDVDPVAYRTRNLPAWLVVDGNYLEKYVFVSATPGRPLPDWMKQSETLEGLAEQISVDAAGLRDEVARFNAFAEEGVDRDFHRGEGAFERFYGDPRHTPNPNLGELSKGPYAAIPIYAGTMGTKGGCLTNHVGHVLAGAAVGETSAPIDGLYAAGNVMASPAGSGYPGAGSTISIAMTFGWLAARDIAGRRA